MAAIHPLRELFTLDPSVTFLNHGSYGAMPTPVRAAQQALRDRLERQPVLFLGRELAVELGAAQAVVAAYLGARPEDLAFVPNATFGVNLIARSLERILQPGDEILANDHEYGACANAWEAVCRRSGARYVELALPMPDETSEGADEYLERIWAGVTPRTRLIFLSHITSPTAIRLPVEGVIARAREAGILTLIDGAHAPGQLDLDLDALGADFYTGNAHKWLCAPKGAAFLHVRSERQDLVEPLTVSWGSMPHKKFDLGSPFQDALIWSGTDDPTAYLAIPAAIAFQHKHDWPAERAHADATIAQWLPRFAAAVGLEPVYMGRGHELRPPQLAVTPMPAGTDAAALKTWLYDECRIEVPVTMHLDRVFVRISFQGYNSSDDLARLEEALSTWHAAHR